MTAAFDFRNPDYIPVFTQRLKRLEVLRNNPELLPGVMGWYRDHPWDLINDWGVTYDPRNVELGLPAVVPFLMFPKQQEWCEWVVGRWKARGPGATPKSRDVGVSWLSVALSVALCLTHEDMAIGFGSRKAEYVDKLSSPKSLFWKAREFIKRLPPEIHGGWDAKRHSVEMRISFPTGSVMTGEAGDGIGRGDRTSIYFVDESAHLERPQLVDASLSATTNCRIDISSANGIGNSFYQKVSSWPAERLFTIHWRDDPRKDEEWYRKQCDELDPVTVAQEIDINFAASATGILIPQAWINAAVDADKVLGFEATGKRRGALDVADEGIDLNAFSWCRGIAVEGVEPWSGVGDDIFGTVQKAFGLCDEHGIEAFDYDADGLGAGVRGDARVINEARALEKRPAISANPFRGSGGVFKPDNVIPSAIPTATRERLERKNGDFFLNAKAQAWWELRVRFQRTFRAVNACLEARKVGGVWRMDYNPDDLIVLRRIPQLTKLTMELSQPTYTLTTAGKIQVDKTPDGARSPNLADAVMILFAPRKANFLSYLGA